jgi:hypothetical protein
MREEGGREHKRCGARCELADVRARCPSIPATACDGRRRSEARGSDASGGSVSARGSETLAEWARHPSEMKKAQADEARGGVEEREPRRVRNKNTRQTPLG